MTTPVHSHLTTGLSLTRWCVGLLMVALLALASGCATRPGGDERDPFEGFNRGVTRFNDEADRLVLKPVASGYVAVVPELVRTGVSNFFSNLEDVWTFVNSVLQLKGRAAADTFGRLMINTTFGLGGIFDIASDAGIDKYHEDFGLTLGRWGVGPGPYLVLPLLGPSTLRDGLATGIETNGSPVSRVDHVPTRNSLYALSIVDKRSAFLNAGNLLEEAALDKYAFTRDAYLQRRRNLLAPDGGVGANDAGADK